MPVSWLHRIVTSSYPSRPPALLRIVFGAISIVRGLEAIRISWPLTSDTVVRIPYATWIPEPDRVTIIVILVVWLVGGACFTVGYRTQISGTALAAAMTVGLLVDQQTYSNHLYLLAILVALLTMSRPGAQWSMDARSGSASGDSVLWPIVLMKLQVSIVYLFAAITKLNAEYLSGSVVAGQLGQGLIPFPADWKVGRVMMVVALASVTVELLIAGYLWHPRRRFVAVGAGVLLHGAIPLLMQPFVQLAVFSAIMLASYVLFIPPEVGGRLVKAPRPLTERLEGLDLLCLLTIEESGTLSTRRGDETVSGWRAVVRVADELPATFLVSPFLRLPLIRSLPNRWAARQRTAA